MSVLCFFTVLLLFTQQGAAQGEGGSTRLDNRQCVILLHGLARTSWSMSSMEQALTASGYVVVNKGYPSRKKQIEQLAMETIPQAVARCGQAQTESIHFVTHSMGGILVRYFLKNSSISNLGRVVMLSPPNGGSEVVDKLREYFFFEWINGPAGQQLGTGPDSLPLRLGPVHYPVGIITGDTHHFYDWYHAAVIPGKDDGKVAVERAKLAGMSDFLVVPCGHSFIMNDRQVIQQTRFFLDHGRFSSTTSKGKGP